MSTLQRPKREGGWDLINIAAKSRALYYHRITVQGNKEGTLTAGWLRHWGLHRQSKIPPNRSETPQRMTYRRTLALDSAYIEKQGHRETVKEYRRRIYNTLKTLLRDTTEPAAMRKTRLWPEQYWETIWENLHMARIPKTAKGKWYCIIHDILPTNERLHKIRLSTTDRCRICNEKDTLKHRTTGCGKGTRMWGWTREKIATMMRMDQRYILEEWTVRPQFKLWPPQRHRAILWMLAQLVIFRTKQQRELTNNDFMDFMRRQKWKIYQQSNRGQRVGN
jgi:hypothetical protein